MFHGHVIHIQCEGDTDALFNLVSLIENMAPYMMDNVIVRSFANLDGSAESMGQVSRLVFPEGSFSGDNDGQAVLYTGIQILTSEENPSIPEGESQVVPWDYDESP